MNNNENEGFDDIFNDPSLPSDHCEMDNQQYYLKIINFLRAKDLNEEDKIPERNWIKIQSANYFVIIV